MKYLLFIMALIFSSLPFSSCLADNSVTESASDSNAPAAAIMAGELPPQLTYDQLVTLLAQNRKAILLLDVRTAEEFAQGNIPGSILAPYDQLAATFQENDMNRPIILYCRSGNRSATAKRTLESMGYTNIADFGALSNWRSELSRP
ncbi:MAG: hypothetical protein A2087_07635 [Spirochaetes bacterium GWD1_61_31]|nr:MAG: hypothetical protein A2Y37_07835 [Spirochaetes bacterium GWB1_60_80]OHD34277.1 MAG: hypothetical protein A2004_12915 [Spirochaetes bacterium GWC1_61_12]OHD40205.1 MAG: hypothetical protein A2087_07635 [Spirochaetes bacterium GWD1_61_31]OHD45747.1 MAG: hypothetical protein A2Y35_03470 [Spirochaetes bacterium GWE1_60_18]OHD58292.1 MAG: hypothetical protein A2Y32_05860 [Spirochaetes bacterium GWF1_60_12]HAX37333.1 hypothetical protein [Spirochaetaceae bacterium]